MILMDCHLPGLSGAEATEAIRARERDTTGHLPIVAITAAAMKGDMEKFIAAGMDDYLSKLYTLEQLKQKLEQWIGADHSDHRHAEKPE